MAKRSMKSDAADRKPVDEQLSHSLIPSYRFVDVYREKAGAEGLAKGQRTLLRLKAGAAEALGSTPYQSLRIADIVACAEISYGLFYHYYKDKEAIVLEVLTEMIARSDQLYAGIHMFEDSYETLFAPNLFYLETYRQNAGLMSAALTLSEEHAGFQTLWNDATDRWHRRIARSLKDQREVVDAAGGAALAAYGLGGMIDQVCRQIFIQQNPYVGGLVHNPVELAEAISVLWFRAVHGASPSAGQIEACRRKYAACAVPWDLSRP